MHRLSVIVKTLETRSTPVSSAIKSSHCVYANAEPSKSHASKPMYASCERLRPGKRFIQLVIDDFTHISTRRPAGPLFGSPATNCAISRNSTCSLLRCRCTNQVNLFSQPLYSLFKRSSMVLYPPFPTFHHRHPAFRKVR